MGLHLTVRDPVALGLFRCSCGHKSILVGHVAMDLFSWFLPLTMGLFCGSDGHGSVLVCTVSMDLVWWVCDYRFVLWGL